MSSKFYILRYLTQWNSILTLFCTILLILNIALSYDVGNLRADLSRRIAANQSELAKILYDEVSHAPTERH